MKLLLLGGEGMLGHKMLQVLRPRFPHILFTLHGSLREPRYARIGLLRAPGALEGVDAMDWGSLENLLREHRPDVVLNCVGIVKQNPEAADPVRCIALNALLPHRLAAALRPWGGKLIHFSTDCVFSGSRGAYAEEDVPDAQDLYGRTKAMGESSGANVLTLRTSFIGRELFRRGSLLEWLLAQRSRTVPGFRNVLYSGLSTIRLAHLAGDLMEKGPDLTGLYHVSGPVVSKYRLLCGLRDAFRLDVEITPEDAPRGDRSLRDGRFRTATGTSAPPWPDMAAELACDDTPYGEWVMRT